MLVGKLVVCRSRQNFSDSYNVLASIGIPLVTMSDRGRDNNGIANLHTAIRQELDPSLCDTQQHRFHPDKQNIKAKVVWSVFYRQFTPGLEDVLDCGVNEGLYHPTDPVEK